MKEECIIVIDKLGNEYCKKHDRTPEECSIWKKGFQAGEKKMLEWMIEHKTDTKLMDRIYLVQFTFREEDIARKKKELGI